MRGVRMTSTCPHNLLYSLCGARANAVHLQSVESHRPMLAILLKTDVYVILLQEYDLSVVGYFDGNQHTPPTYVTFTSLLHE